MLIDVSRLVTRFLKGRLPTGIDRVCQAYLAHYGPGAQALVRLGRHNVVFNHRMSLRMFHTLQAAPTRTRIQYAQRIVRGIAAGGLSRVRAGTVLFNPGHSGLESENYYRLIQSRKLAPVFVVHDLIPLTHAEYCRPGEREKHLARIKQVWETGRAVVTNSQATLDALTAFAARHGAQLPPCTVALLGPGKPAHTACKRIIAEPYFVVLGTIEPRKNHLLLLQVWRHLVEQFGNRAPRLVLIGQRGWECENVVDLLERCETLRGFVTELHACSDAELSSYLHHAQALLFPSFAEGYGMPVLEALAQGVPAIASNLPVFQEFARDIPEYIDPLDGRQWMETIIDFAKPGSVLRKKQMERLAKFEPPTWANHFERVDRLLRSITDSQVGKPAGIVHPLPYGSPTVPG
jgi:glycosyltransferase involved in cell wall biosynthesis